MLVWIACVQQGDCAHSSGAVCRLWALRQSIYIQVTASLQQWSIFRCNAAKHAVAILSRGNWQQTPWIRGWNVWILQGNDWIISSTSQLSAGEEEKKKIRRERNKMAAAKCRNRRRELTDTLQIVSKQWFLYSAAICTRCLRVFHCGWLWLSIRFEGDRQAGGGKSRPGDGNSQPPQRERAAWIDPCLT